MKVFRRLLPMLSLLLLCACAPQMDSEAARLCRLILPVLHQSGTTIDVASVGPLDAVPEHPFDGIRIDYLAREPSRRHSAHYVLCTFDPVDGLASQRVLRGVTTDLGPVGAAPLLFISRYYLNDPESAASTPGPGTTELAQLPQMPEALGPLLQHALSLLPMTGVYALLATSYALVYGLIGRINLAFGAFAAIGGVGGSLALVALQAFARTNAGSAAPPLLILLGAIVTGVTLAACWGEALAATVIGPLLRHGSAMPAAARDQRGEANASHAGQPVLIATAGVLIAVPELLAILQETRWLTPVLNTPRIVAVAGPLQITYTPISVIVFCSCVVLALCILALMKHSRFGRAWRASADDPLTASLFGVSQMRVLAITLTLSCALAGFAGFVFCIQYGNFGYSDGRIIGLKALVAAIAGGIGSLPGAMLGGILLGLAEAIWSANLPIESRDTAIFLALVALLVFRPGGLFGYGDLTPRRA